MASSTSGLSQQLQSLTRTKIREIEKQRKKYEDKKHAILNTAKINKEDQHKLVAELLSGVKESIPSASADAQFSNIRRWLDQSHYDASIPVEMLNSFEKQLRTRLDQQSCKLDLANLYSHLIEEWMNPPSKESTASDVEDSEESYEVLERQKERLRELCDKFESVVFEPLETDEVEIEKYLQELFSGEDGMASLKSLRENMEMHGNQIFGNITPFDNASLKWCIKGLLVEDLLSEEKQDVLRDFLENDLVLAEIADVLNMRFGDLESWSWAADEGIPVMPRQQLNGKYRIWMDEDVLQAIFIHYIGISWCVALKKTLSNLVTLLPIWRWDEGSPMPKEERDKRRYFLKNETDYGGISEGVNWERRSDYLDTFFLSSLPSTNEALYTGGGYDNDVQEPQGKGVKKSSIKQQLLRKLATEILLRQSLDEEVAVVQSDLQWYATGLSHNTIFSIMKFVGFSEKWITFFRKFLEAPLNMSPASGDSSTANQTRIRKRGVPMAHAPEKLIGELVLFIMDLAVNRETSMLLYRIHDDLWLCGKPDQCAKSWKTMGRFAKVMGVEFNFNKTGSVYMTENGKKQNSEIASILPKGPVSVGHLTLDAKSGTWIIDQEAVNKHVEQLKRQLDGCDSILSWVQTWNSCIGRFFSHTFGEPASCFGGQHVQSILQTHERIQKTLFPNSNVAQHLKSMIRAHFGASDIPDAFLYMPEHFGGLGLRNPFIPFFLAREHLTKEPKDIMLKFLADEKDQYIIESKAFETLQKEKRRTRFKSFFPHGFTSKTPQPNELDTFISFEAYTRWRESASWLLVRTYKELLSTPLSDNASTPPEVERAVQNLGRQFPEVSNLDREKRWLLNLHAAELFEKCGDLSMVEKRFLPLGVLTMMRTKKVTWQMVL